MKKFISTMLAALLTVTSFSAVSIASASDAETEPATLSADFVSQITENGSKIPNTYAKIKNGQDINLGYFGGSVTNGYAPANPPYNPSAPGQGVDCWRGRSQVWLNATYGTPNGVTIMETNGNRGTKYHAGLGGTGIDLNLYRANNGLGLSTDDPVDLLFIEFSINDSYEGNTYEKSAYYMESTLRMIREKSPTTDIVVMITTDHTKLSQLGNSKLHEQGQAHVDVAEYYGIPWFWFGDYMYEFLISENEKLGNGRVLPSSGSALWQTYMADGCHPSVQGYQKYFEFLRDNFLKPNLDNEKGTFSTTVVNYTVPEIPYNQTQAFFDGNKEYHANSGSVYYKEELRRYATDVAPANIRNFGKAGYGYNPGNNGIITATTTNPGMAFSVKVKAKSAGMFYTGHPDKGMIQYRVDGGEWKYHNMYKSSTNQNEYFMFFEKLEEKEHTVDVILRKTMNGSAMIFRGIFLDGDSTGFGAEILEGAPNKTPLNDLVQTPIVLTPELLNTKISGGEYTNNASSFEVYHHGVTDTDVLRYTPNPASSDTVASDCYNSTFASVSLPTYKYAVIKYYYELEPGTTESNAEGNRPFINFLQLVDKKSCGIASADKLILGGVKANNAIIDLTAITARTGHKGNLKQMHFRPFGENVKGSALVSTELMNVDSISFYAEYPFNNEYDIDVAVNGGAGTNVNLDGKRILPSAHKYATVKYNAEEDATITLEFNGLYDLAANNYNKTFTASKAVKEGAGEVIIPLTEIAESGQTYYYGNVKTNADKNVTFDSITFSVNYPNPDEQFKIEFDANGGTGAVPNPIYGKHGDKIALPEASMENGSDIFLGWSKTPDGSQIVSEILVPVDGMTLYATYAKAGVLTYDLNGGSGSIPSKVKIAVGRESSLMSADITKGNSVFLGWGTSPTATTTIDKITMTESGVTVYAIFKELRTVYVAADGSVNYNGVEHTADYADIAAAFAALGTSGGHIIFEGIFPGTENVGVKGAPLYILEGADGNAGLTFTGYTVNFQCNLKLKNLAFLRYSQDPYFYANGYKIVFDEGFGFYGYNEDAANKRGSETGLKGGLRGGKAIMNDGMLASYFTGGNYNASSSGNTYMEFNANSSSYGFTMGSYYFDQYPANSFTHTGNATVVINGGTFSNKNIKVDHNSKFTTTVTGATSVILNNGISGFNFDSKIKYVISSTSGGKVSLAADGTSSYAPTFFIKANNPEALIYIDGVEVPAENGEYLFMPKITGKYSVTYKAGTKAYANADGSGKLTVDGVEYPAYNTILEAMSALDSTGGTVYFSGTHADMTSIIAATSGMEAITFRGVDANSRIQFPANVWLKADTTFENMNFIKTTGGASSPYIYANGHKLTVGKLGDDVQPARLNTDGSVGGIETLGGTNMASEFVLNGGKFANIGLIDWGASTHAKDVLLTINGGTINPIVIRTNFTGTATVNANLVFTINGGKYETASGNKIDPKANVSGNSIIIFNNDYADKLTSSGFKYIIDAPAGIKVEATSYGSSTTAPTFKLTPAEGIEKVFVNKAEVAANGGVYTYTPTATGTFVVEADLVLPAVTFVKGEGETGDAPASVTGNVGAEIAIPECTLAKEGKRLAGWATTAGKVNPEFTTTFTMTAGGITLYPVWRDADTMFVAASGTLTYNGTEYVADYTDLVTAVKEKGATIKTFVFAGAYAIGDVFTNTTANTEVTFEGVGDDGILYAAGTSAVNAYVRANLITLDNVKILKKIQSSKEENGVTKYTYTDFYIQGGNHGVAFRNNTGTFLEAAPDTNTVGNETDAIKSYELSKFIFHSGKAGGQMHIGGYASTSTSGNKYFEIDGTAIPASVIQLGGLAWGAKNFTHNGNITVVINGGNLKTNHWINVDATSNIITDVIGAVSVIINNDLASTTNFNFDSKIEYRIKSGIGGQVSLNTEGSETTAPTFLIKADANKTILIDGVAVEDNNGEYLFTPTEKKTYAVTYEAKPTDVEFEIVLGGKDEESLVIVDDETGYDGRATLEIEGMEIIYLEEANGNESTLTANITLEAGTYSVKIKKPGYITYNTEITVNDDGTFEMDEIPALIAGDITDSFDSAEGDSKINIDDFVRILRGFNADTSATRGLLLRQYTDINEDGVVNVSDLAILKANFGKTASSYDGE